MQTPEQEILPLPDGTPEFTIRPDTYCWVVTRNVVSQNGKKRGEVYQQPLFYNSTFAAAVTKLHDYCCREAANHMPLLDAFNEGLQKALDAAADAKQYFQGHLD